VQPIDPNQEGAARQIFVQNLNARAKAAYDKRVVEGKYTIALAGMHEMDGVINADNPIISNMNFTDAELEELFKRYCDLPRKSENSGNSMRLMDQVVKLDGNITAAIAVEFKQWSDRYPHELIQLKTICDKSAIFTLNHKISGGIEKLGITEDEAANWLIRWTHTDLATAMVKLWNYDTQSSQFLNINQALREFQLKLHTPQLNISNEEGEC
jgi:hypothetical protein